MTAVLTVVVAALLWLITSPSAGSFTAAVQNVADQAGSGTLGFTLSGYPGGPCTATPQTPGSCAGYVAPASVPSSGASTQAATFTSAATVPAAAITEQVAATSCAPVDLANAATAASPLLVRYGTSYSSTPPSGLTSGAGALTLNGASPGGSATSLVAETIPGPLSVLSTYGVGIAFKTTATGPLFEIGSSRADASGGNARLLYLNSAGQLVFSLTGSGATITSTTKYNDGTWHFAYVQVTVPIGALGVSLSVISKLYVDGGTATTATNLLSLSSVTGYWHLGYSGLLPTGLPSYLSGSLANFVVFNGGNAPVGPSSSQLNGVSTFNTWAANANDRYPLNDTGTGTFTGTYPNGVTNPCSQVAIGWGSSNPTSCAFTPTTATTACPATPTGTPTALVAAGLLPVATAPAGTGQTLTMTVTRGSTYSTAFSPGLHLLVPLTIRQISGTWSATASFPASTSTWIQA